MSLLNTPPGNTPVDEIVPVAETKVNFVLKISNAWLNWANQIFRICSGLTLSGTTANRPTVGLWVGRPYFDTSLGAKGKPIWVGKDGVTWVLADGTAA